MRIGSGRLGRGGHRLERQWQRLRPHRLLVAVMIVGVLALAVVATIAATRTDPPKRETLPPLTDAQVAAMVEAATSCPPLSAARLAAQVMATTAFEPTADGGIAGLSADEWQQWKPWDDAVASDDRASLLALAHLTCDLVGQLRVSGFSGDLWPLAVAAFVSSLDEVRATPGVPAGVVEVVDRAQVYADAYAQQVNEPHTSKPSPQTSPAGPSPSSEPTASATASPTFGVTSAAASVSHVPTSAQSSDFSLALSRTSASVVQGSAITVTVTSSVTAGSAQPVALSTSGLPAGTTASFNPASVTAGGSATLTLQTSGSTPPGQSTITIRGAGSVVHTASMSVTVTPADTCTSPGQKLGNPGFESGSSPWTASSGVIDDYTQRTPHSGSRFAWLAGYGETSTTRLYQTVSLPTGCTSYTFSFWLHVDSAESTSSSRYDTMTVQVLDSNGNVLKTLATYSNLDEASGYRQKSFNLASYAGQSIQLRFTAYEDYSRQTSFIIDDTAMDVS